LLSKSQARLFFLLFTGGFSFVFLGLTVDTVRQVPERSHEAAMTPQVLAGKQLWDENNCMGCHTLLGEGAYYAPELTKVVERRGAAWIDLFLQDPQRMFPGQRKMVKYDFTAEERQDLIAFFGWIGKVDTNGFPAKPDMNLNGAIKEGATTAPLVAARAADGPDPLLGAPEMFKTVCTSCHMVGGKGGTVGPALDGVASRYSRAELDTWLRDPQAVKPGTAMPNFGLADDVRHELVEWLMTHDSAEASR